jgi:Outer membrane protein beta-barrel domain
MSLRLLAAVLLLTGLAGLFPKSAAAGIDSVYSTRHDVQLADTDFDRFEVSIGYNYLHLHDADPEPEHLHGVDLSGFVNLNSWLAIGGDFMADFGNVTRSSIFGGSFDVDSQRYIYVFGPKVTVWRNSQFRVFLEALAGGVHARAEASAGSFSQTASADGFAAAGGIGADWRFSEHFSWRMIQADYIPTDLEGDWQHNFRVSTGFVYSFGRR